MRHRPTPVALMQCTTDVSTDLGDIQCGRNGVRSVANELPYLASHKNVATLFSKIQSAKRPEAFTTRYLANTLGLKGSNDRALISLLRTLGFIDAAGRPTQAYGALKNPDEAPKAIAAAIRSAYEPLFSANEAANALSSEALKGLIAQVAGTDKAMTARIAGTFNALVKLADFSGGAPLPAVDEDEEDPEVDEEERRPAPKSRLRPEFHYNIQVHLPSNGSEETYLNIFNAIRKTFK